MTHEPRATSHEPRASQQVVGAAPTTKVPSHTCAAVRNLHCLVNFSLGDTVNGTDPKPQPDLQTNDAKCDHGADGSFHPSRNLPPACCSTPKAPSSISLATSSTKLTPALLGILPLQWRSFDFFDTTQIKLADDDTRAFFESSGNDIASVCSGSDSLFLGSYDGTVRIVGPSWKVVRSFRAYDDAATVTHMRQVEGTSLLVTVAEEAGGGGDAAGSSHHLHHHQPVLKVWALDRPVKKTGMPTCLSTVAVNNGKKPFPVCGGVLAWWECGLTRSNSHRYRPLPRPKTCRKSRWGSRTAPSPSSAAT